jgi:hypothetical protein
LGLENLILPIKKKNSSQPFEQIIEQFQNYDVKIIDADSPQMQVVNSDGVDVIESTATANGSIEIKKSGSDKMEDEGTGTVQDVYPGKIFVDFSSNEIELNKDHEVVLLSVTNIGDEPISVGSHYNFIEANKNLKFDRSAAFGLRLVC